MGFWRQLGLLLWKNLLLQRRQKCVLLFEISLPLLFALIFLLLRFNVTVTTTSQATLYSDFSVDANQTGSFDNYTYGDTLLFCPNSSVIHDLMSKVVQSARDENVELKTLSFATQSDLLNHYKFYPDNVTYAIVFNVSEASLPKSLHYSLRPRTFNFKRWNTDSTSSFAESTSPRNAGEPDYKGSGFLWLQKLIDEAVIKTWHPAAHDLDIRLQRMPFPPYVEDGMIGLLQILFPVLLMMSFILMAIQTAKGVVYEKERKLKESMKLMGLSAAAHWASWFLTISVYIIIFSVIYTIFCGVDISGNGAVLANTDPSLFFVFLLCYGTAVTTFCFMVSVFIHKANVAAALTGIIYFVTYCPYFYLQTVYEDMNKSEKLGASLLFNLALGFGAQGIGLLEGTGEGAQWSNFSRPTSADNYSLLEAMLMLLGDSAIHLLVTWYVDNVRPGEFGVPQPWYFPFTARYWCGSEKVIPNSEEVLHKNDEHFEKEPTDVQAGIVIRNLRKVFGHGHREKVAVDRMNLNMYEGQISVLLGHNGAGKTTTMSMLTGFIPASGGTAMVNGYNINTDILSVRQSLGLCPQHNILFDTLTVQEHLEFFASLKGCSGRHQKNEVETMLKEIGLTGKRNTQSQHLSGGQKRKLSVGIALIGGSKVVILDEPTSGMDPAARRQTWDILQRNRAGRTMLLTTHFMDEADLLGDRIAIMAEGVVKCCGTSYFLKKLYGAGYHLVIVKDHACEVTAVTSLVTQHVPTASLESEINAELSYLLPDDQSSKFAELFTRLEDHSRRLGISSFGISATTMEEVFLKVDTDASEAEVIGYESSHKINTKSLMTFSNPLISVPGDQEDVKINEPLKSTESKNGSYGTLLENGVSKDLLDFNQGFVRAQGLRLELSRFRGMFVKKMLHTWRNKAITLTQMLLPVIFAIVALVSTQFTSTQKPEPSMALTLGSFGRTTVPYQNGTTPFTDSAAQKYVSSFDRSRETLEWVNLNTFHNMSDYFLSKIDSLGLHEFRHRVIIGGEFESDTTVRGHYNGEPYHSQPISLNYIMNSILKFYTTADHSIITDNHPLPQNTSSTSKNSRTVGLSVGFAISFIILFGMAFLTSSFVFFLIKERLVGAKHLQVVSGVGPFVFWMSNLAWDFVNYILSCVLVLIAFAAFQTDAYTGDGRFAIILLVFVTYGWSVLPFMYTLQYWFKTPASGMVILTMLNIITGMVSIQVTFILTLLRANKNAIEVIDWILSILFPHHAFGMTFMEMYSNYGNLEYCREQNYEDACARGFKLPCCKDNCGENCIDFSPNFLQWELPGIGRYVLIMTAQGLFYFLLILFIDYQIPQKIKYLLSRDTHDTNWVRPWGSTSTVEDDDVASERQRISKLSPSGGANDAIILKNLTKEFGNFVAVDNLCVGISERECFGLLGQNGAGKTTTFRMLTGDVMLTAGNAYLWSYDVRNNVKKVQENMGYCPQFDALIDQMTGRETLAMYARLKGIPESCIPQVCDNLLDSMMLYKYADIPTSEYSGGNKRKLSTAIALVGDPAFIMLDEPSTGMDPKARRHMWTVLSKIRESGRTLILTSHSMEECDALCTKIAIMVNARFVCLGTPQHLKNKFGQGYTLVARMALLPDGQGPAPNQPLIDFIKETFPDTMMFDDHQGYVHFQVPYAAVSLAKVFTLMEDAKERFSVEDYSVYQTTLEQVFLSFTKGQVPPAEPPKKPKCRKMCCCCYCCCCCC